MKSKDRKKGNQELTRGERRGANAEGYRDPTANAAIRNVMKEQTGRKSRHFPG